MNPIKVRAYGLVPVAKRTYFIIQGACFSLLGVLFVVTLVVPVNGESLRQSAQMADSSTASAWLFVCASLMDWAAWILGAAILAGILETVSMSARFRAAERAETSGPHAATDMKRRR